MLLTGGTLFNLIMEFIEKKETATRLSDDRYIETDRAYMARFCPGHSLLQKRIDAPGGDTLSFDIIYTLLGLGSVTEEMIQANRAESSAQFVFRKSTEPAAEAPSSAENIAPVEQIMSKSEEKQVKKKTRNTRTSSGKNLTGKKSSGRS